MTGYQTETFLGTSVCVPNTMRELPGPLDTQSPPLWTSLSEAVFHQTAAW